MLLSKIFIFFACMFIIATKNVENGLAFTVCIPPVQSTVSDMEQENGEKCVCTYGIHGRICRFQAPAASALDLNATWNSNESFHITWNKNQLENETGVRYRLTFRKVFNTDYNNIVFAKWRRLNIVNNNNPGQEVEIHKFNLPLGNNTYEVKLETFFLSGNHRATSVFLEPPKPLGLTGLTEIFEEKDSSCFQNGLIIGSLGGALGSLVLLTLFIAIIRKCKNRNTPLTGYSGKYPSFPNPCFIEEDTPDMLSSVGAKIITADYENKSQVNGDLQTITSSKSFNGSPSSLAKAPTMARSASDFTIVNIKDSNIEAVKGMRQVQATEEHSCPSVVVTVDESEQQIPTCSKIVTAVW